MEVTSAALGAVWALLSALTPILARFSSTRWLHMDHSGVFSLVAFVASSAFFFSIVTSKDYLHLLPFPHIFFYLSLFFLIVLIIIRLFLFDLRRQSSRNKKLCVLFGLLTYSLSIGFFTAGLTDVAIAKTHRSVSGRLVETPIETRSLNGVPIYVRYGRQAPFSVTITDPHGHYNFFVDKDQIRQITMVLSGDSRPARWCPDPEIVGQSSFVMRAINFAHVISVASTSDPSDQASSVRVPDLFAIKDSQLCPL